jgi:transcription initiation factor TFIID subunit 12
MNNMRQQMTAIAERHPNFIRPEQINQIMGLSQEQKPKLQSLVNSCWNILGSKPESDPQFQAALTKLEEVSTNIAKLVQNQRAKQLAQQQQANQAGGQQAAAANAQQIQAQAAQRAANAAGQAKPGVAGAQQGPSKQVLEALSKQQLHLPPDIQPGTEQGNKTLAAYRNQFVGILTRMEKVMTQLGPLNSMVSQGKAIPEQYQQAYQTLLKERDQCQKAINAFRQQQASNLRARQQQQVPGQSQTAGVPNAGAKPTVSVNTAIANAKGIIANTPGSAATASPAFKAQIGTPMSATGPGVPRSSASPISATQPQAPPFSATSNPQQRPQQRPGLNTQPAQTTQTSAASATPIPYSQTAALNAARSHSEQNPQRSNSQSQYPSPGQTTPSTQPKHPISKSLPDGTMAPPKPIQMGPTRPTLGQGGVLNQPIISSQPVFQLEGESSSRVLSKKKLDELVRQVTGGTETLSPEVEEVSSLLCSAILT